MLTTKGIKSTLLSHSRVAVKAFACELFRRARFARSTKKFTSLSNQRREILYAEGGGPEKTPFFCDWSQCDESRWETYSTERGEGVVSALDAKARGNGEENKRKDLTFIQSESG